MKTDEQKLAAIRLRINRISDPVKDDDEQLVDELYKLIKKTDTPAGTSLTSTKVAAVLAALAIVIREVMAIIGF